MKHVMQTLQKLSSFDLTDYQTWLESITHIPLLILLLEDILPTSEKYTACHTGHLALYSPGAHERCSAQYPKEAGIQLYARMQYGIVKGLPCPG